MQDQLLQYGPYVVPTHNTYFNDYYYETKIFDDNKIQKVESYVNNNLTFQKGLTAGQTLDMPKEELYRTNNRNIAYITPNPDTQWLYEFLFPIALEANKQLFGFDIDFVTDPIHYVIYPEDGGHLDYHMDIGNGFNTRKLAMTVQLSDPHEYEGGNFDIWQGGKDMMVTLPREKGDIIVFPVWLMHRIAPITRGQRKCLVFWTGGKPFK